jgi:hypothetical protein
LIELAGEANWIEYLARELLIFDMPFEGPGIRVQFEVIPSTHPPPDVRGSYLRCNRLRADRAGSGFILRGEFDAWCRFDEPSRSAIVWAPKDSQDVMEDVEQFLIFAMVWGWRAAGWTALHVAAIERHGHCALVCAESCGGKSTFTAACLRRGFRTLGDDKVLIRASMPVVAQGLSRSMNLDPAVSRWFPETARVGELAAYSRWTPKRKVDIESLWPGATEQRAVPTILLRLTRGTGTQAAPILLSPMAPQQVIDAISRQTVIPQDRAAAAAILPAVMGLSQQLRGWTMTVSPEAYRDPGCLGIIEELFE